MPIVYEYDDPGERLCIDFWVRRALAEVSPAGPGTCASRELDNRADKHGE